MQDIAFDSFIEAKLYFGRVENVPKYFSILLTWFQKQWGK